MQGERYYLKTNGVMAQSEWLEIDNQKYFAFIDGRIARGMATIGGLAYLFNDDGVLLSNISKTIDVSSYQGLIDWAKVKASGTDYAIIRSLTWSKTVPSPDGNLGWWTPDAYFDYNVRAAKAAGIKVGAYIYTYAFNSNEVQAEVKEFLKVMEPLIGAGYRLDLPVFVDQEYNPLLGAVPDINIRTDLIRQEMDLLRTNGFYPGFYTYTSWAQNNINAAQLQNEGYDFWVADYRGELGYSGPKPVVGWQYSSTGQVPGISRNVDMNHWYKDYTGLISGSNNLGASTADAQFSVYDLNTRTVKRDNMSNLLAGITANEVGGTSLVGSQATQLFSAQAVAARSWLLASMKASGNPPQVGLNYAHAKFSTIQQAVAPVVQKYVSYNGAPALTAYGSSGNGSFTNSALNYFGQNLPYLTSVSSKDFITANYYMGTRELSRAEAEVKADLVVLMGGDFSAGIAPQNWIKIVSRDISTGDGSANRGYVTAIEVWGKNVSISKFYEMVWGITSPDFTFTYSAGTFKFLAYGYGSGVGMSQYGAIQMASEGRNWVEILNHYYPGTSIS